MAMTALGTALFAAVTTGAQMYEANQQKQDAKGVANNQQDAINKQLADATATTTAATKAKADTGSATQASAMAALRASMSASSGMGGTILTGPQGALPAPTQTKTLLGL